MFGFIGKSNLLEQVKAIIDLIREIHDVLSSHREELNSLRNDLEIIGDTTRGLQHQAFSKAAGQVKKTKRKS